MHNAKPHAVSGYHKVRYKAGQPAIAAPNQLYQVFVASSPAEVWVSDITQTNTHEGWLCLAAVNFLYSRSVVGWSM